MILQMELLWGVSQVYAVSFNTRLDGSHHLDGTLPPSTHLKKFKLKKSNPKVVAME